MQCSNKVYPVAMEGQYIELERAYLNSGIDSGEEVMIQLRGRLLERPAMEGNHNEVKLIVDSFNKLLPDKTCAPTVHAELLDTYWKLTELNGNAVATTEEMAQAHMVLASAESKVHGNAGCNNFFGGFAAAQASLTFSALGSTMMACPRGMDEERDFLAALGATTRYEISGLFLSLYAGSQLLARLEAVYLQ
jgi:heat shock protein HslJ